MNRMYLPIKILDKQWAEQLMQGNVYMRALAEFGAWNMEARRKNDEDINNDFRGDVKEGLYKNVAPEESDEFFDGFSDDLQRIITHKFYIDEAEQYTRIFSMSKLEYDKKKQQFQAVESEMQEFGDTAVIILNPQEFFFRLSQAYLLNFPDRFVVEVGDVRYLDMSQDYGYWGIYAKEKRYEWQKEVRIAARLREDVVTTKSPQSIEPVTLRIGNMQDIAIMVPVQQLLQGQLPEKVYEKEVLERILPCDEVPVGITGEAKVIAGDFTAIEPQKEWIQEWQEIFEADMWKPVTVMEQVVPDGAKTPRLAFFRVGGKGRVYFWRNKLELQLEAQPETATELFAQMMELLERKGFSGYCHLLNVFHVNLGEIDDRNAKKAACSEMFSVAQRPYFYTHQLDIAALRHRNVFGLDLYERRWHYTLKISTPPEEHMRWYNRADVIAFFRRTDELAVEVCGELQGGDVYGKYHSL